MVFLVDKNNKELLQNVYPARQPPSTGVSQANAAPPNTVFNPFLFKLLNFS